MKEEYYFPSADDITQIHVCEWRPEGVPKAVLQIAHGMNEYIERYTDFAEVLSARGVLVVGNDHLGHGRSVSDENAYGYFSENTGPDDVLSDMHILRTRTQERFPDVPYFFLGQGMGSVFVRCYLTRRSEGLAGAIIMGTFTAAPPAVTALKGLCRTIGGTRGWNHFSKTVNRAAVGGYNKDFKEPQTSVDWLSRDPANNKQFENDPMCSHPFTVNAYYAVYDALEQAEKPRLMENIDKDLPIFLVSGEEDPAGNRGKDIPRIAKWYQQEDIREVEYKLYKGDRHDILHELDRHQVYADLEKWIFDHI